MNRGTVADAFGVEDDLNANTDELNMNIAQLEKVFPIFPSFSVTLTFNMPLALLFLFYTPP